MCTDECAKRGYAYYWCHKVKLFDDDDDDKDDHDIDNPDDDHHDVDDAGVQQHWLLEGF